MNPQGLPGPEPGYAKARCGIGAQAFVSRTFWGTLGADPRGLRAAEHQDGSGFDSLRKDNFHPRRRITFAGKNATPNEID